MRPLKLLLLCVFLFAGLPANAQNLTGVKIQVATEALTYLKFNSDITRFEFGGDHDDYTAQVIDNDQLRIKTLNSKPSPTNLVVNEGGRTHMFIIQVIEKIDINNFKAYYDYSDLKVLKKLAAASAATDPVVATANITKPAELEAKPDPKAERKAEKERKEREEKAAAAKKEQEQREAKAKQEAAEQERKELAEAEKAKQDAAREKIAQQEREAALAKDIAIQKKEAVIAAKQAEEENKKLKAEKAQRDKDAATAKQREKQLEKEHQQEIAAAKKREADEAKQKQAEEKARLAREAQREKDIAAAKEKDRQAAIAKAEAQRKEETKKQQLIEQARLEQKEKEEAIVKEKERKLEEERQRVLAAEKERQRQEEIARKRQEAIEKERLRQEEKLRQQQIALEKEKARKEEEARKAEEARLLAIKRAKERAEANIKNPYWKTEWHKRYPQVNFAEPPVGQMLTGEYFLPNDTALNSAAASKALADAVHFTKYSEKADNVTVNLDGITFSGVNAFMRIHITNASAQDYLVGKIILTWWKKGGGSYYLKPCYVSVFPVVYPGQDVTIVVGCRGVNATDNDDFSLSVSERLSGKELQIPFTGKMYNKEMNR